MVLKFMRVLNLKSEHLSELEIYFLLVRLVDRNLPRNYILNIDKNLNAEHRNETSLFSLPVLEYVAANGSDIHNTTFSALGEKSFLDIEEPDSPIYKNVWVSSTK